MTPLLQLPEEDQDVLLLKCADGEVLLYVELRPFKAKLQAQSWARSPKQAVWTADARTKVWLNPAAASLLLSFPDADVKWFEPESSDDIPFPDNVYFLEEPQTVTRENVYCDLPSYGNYFRVKNEGNKKERSAA